MISTIQTETCKNCKSFIAYNQQAYVYKGEIVCGKCEKKLNAPMKIKAERPKPLIAKCKMCEGVMRKGTKAKYNWFLMLLGLISTIGLCLTVIGLLPGILALLTVLYMGGQKIKFWKCSRCNTTTDIN